jgi:Ferritin-like domain
MGLEAIEFELPLQTLTVRHPLSEGRCACMSKMDAQYIQLTNDVLAVNYWGELLTVELLATLLRRRPSREFAQIVVRQLMDETRHANVTRALLLERGRDPVREDSVAEFTYHKLFREWSEGSVEDVLTFLGSNERSSSRNFSSLIKVGIAAGDDSLVSIYSEILNDEVKHAYDVFALLPDTAATKAVCDRADEAMQAALNMRYARLVMSYPAAFGRKSKTAARGASPLR